MRDERKPLVSSFSSLILHPFLKSRDERKPLVSSFSSLIPHPSSLK
jgi:hypothetical protein